MRTKLISGLLFIVALLGLSGCARQAAANSWPRIEQSKKVVIGLDDTFVPMGFRERMGKSKAMISI